MRRIACGLLLATAAAIGSGQTTPEDALTLQTDAVAPARFVAAHGQQAILMGYSGHGLEAWAYPFQLFRGYRVSFLPASTGRTIPGSAILRRIEYRPSEIVRIYVGPDFEIREHLFVPLHQPGIIIRYEVEGGHAVDIRVTFLPVLNLMWPAALGGQDLRWNDALAAYEISEITTGYRALIGSPQQTLHSPVVNSTLRRDLTQSMLLHPQGGLAQVYAALEHGAEPEGAELKTVEEQGPALLKESRAHQQAFLAEALHVQTPDQAVNRALEWSKIALGQAWVCNRQLGCGLVAGYGPSRGMRRPQYAWFFAGDGLIATEALLADGDTARARDELQFILNYQNAGNGMIWHELSQSAGLIDWVHKYPYMYVHVDITFSFLSTLADYYQSTGDLDFLRARWQAINAAYRYCRALVNPATGLPQIPLGKEGGNEQERMHEDVALSAAWLTASEAYGKIAAATGHATEATAAAKAAATARSAFANRYWDNTKRFWIAGYSESGAAMTDERSHPGLLGQGLLSPQEENEAMGRIASADFQTDWGTRGMGADSPHFDPVSYASGSVSALGTAETAEAFWNDHRPAIALAIWDSLLPWLQLDSLGHLHEVAAGDFFHPQVESVPEQTWSSAGLLSAAVHGLLGIERNAPEHRLTLAPHLDPRWDRLSLADVAVGVSSIAADLHQADGEIDGTFSAHGGLVHLTFAPEIPLGASGIRATANGQQVPVAIERHDQDEHARVGLDLSSAKIHCRIQYSGGVRVLAPPPQPVIGARTRQLKLTSIALRGRQLTLDADVAGAADASLRIKTEWRIQNVEGGTAQPDGRGWYKLSFANAPSRQSSRFARLRMTVRFQTR